MAEPRAKRTNRKVSYRGIDPPTVTVLPAPVIPEPAETRPAIPEGAEERGEAIARLAYSYWEARGCQGGSPEEDWFRAEQELQAGRSGGPNDHGEMAS
jgi:hypothetical protein